MTNDIMLYYLWYWLGYDMEPVYNKEIKIDVKVIKYKYVIDELKDKIKRFYIE